MYNSVFIETFGCQMNVLDSELVKINLKKSGYKVVNHNMKADIILYNSCSVRSLSEKKIISRLGHLKKRKKNKNEIIIGILGCMAERRGKNILKNNKHINFLVGPNHIDEIPDLLKKAEKNIKNVNIVLDKFKERNIKKKGNSFLKDLNVFDTVRNNTKKKNFKAFVRITKGCNNFCSFCVVPQTRGPEYHKDPDVILKEIFHLVEKGVKEVILLGQTINHYSFIKNNIRISFADLLDQIHKEVPNLLRIRFLTSHPKNFSDKILKVMSSNDRICNYLHIPLQSGSNRILKLMNRGYKVEDYLCLINKVKKKIPSISIFGDMIVGFPSETNEDFQKSLNLLKLIKYRNVFIFKYSERSNTIASKYFIDDITINIKKERHELMLKLQRKITLSKKYELMGKKVLVLVEKSFKIEQVDNNLVFMKQKIILSGRTMGNDIIHFNGFHSMIGQTALVKITKINDLMIFGNLVKVF